MTTRNEIDVKHTATGNPASAGSMSLGRLHTHQVIFNIPSGTGDSTVIHEGTNDPDGLVGWTTIFTSTLVGQVDGTVDKTTLEHAWLKLRSRCTVLNGTGASVRSMISGS